MDNLEQKALEMTKEAFDGFDVSDDWIKSSDTYKMNLANLKYERAKQDLIDVFMSSKLAKFIIKVNEILLEIIKSLKRRFKK